MLEIIKELCSVIDQMKWFNLQNNSMFNREIIKRFRVFVSRVDPKLRLGINPVLRKWPKPPTERIFIFLN